MDFPSKNTALTALTKKMQTGSTVHLKGTNKKYQKIESFFSPHHSPSQSLKLGRWVKLSTTLRKEVPIWVWWVIYRVESF